MARKIVCEHTRKHTHHAQNKIIVFPLRCVEINIKRRLIFLKAFYRLLSYFMDVEDDDMKKKFSSIFILFH